MTTTTEPVELVSASIVNTDGDLVLSGAIAYGSTDFSSPDVGFLRADASDVLIERTLAATDTSYLDDYDQFVADDPTWETTKDEAMATDFSVLQTKYFSVQSAYDAVRNGMAISFFWATLKDIEVRWRSEPIQVPGSAELGAGVKSMNLMEAFVSLLVLTLWKFEVNDLIPHGESGVSTILAARTDGAAFPGEGDLLPYSTRLARVAELPDPLSVDDVTEINETNVGVSDKIRAEIASLGKAPYFGYDPLRGGEESRDLGQLWQMRQMWDHKFVSRLQTEAFGASPTYHTWLQQSNAELAAWVAAQDEAGTHNDAILTLIAMIDDVIDSDLFDFGMSLGARDVIMTYVRRMITFFKAYTTDLHDFQIYMLISDPANETIRLMNLLAAIDVDLRHGDGLKARDERIHESGLRREERTFDFREFQRYKGFLRHSDSPLWAEFLRWRGRLLHASGLVATDRRLISNSLRPRAGYLSFGEAVYPKAQLYAFGALPVADEAHPLATLTQASALQLAVRLALRTQVARRVEQLSPEDEVLMERFFKPVERIQTSDTLEESVANLRFLRMLRLEIRTYFLYAQAVSEGIDDTLADHLESFREFWTLTEQVISELNDRIAHQSAAFRLVTPAASLRDEPHIRTVGVRGDFACVRSGGRGESPGGGAGLDDNLFITGN